MYLLRLSSYKSEKKINPNLSHPRSQGLSSSLPRERERGSLGTRLNLSLSYYIVRSMFPAMFPTVFVAGIFESVATPLITCVMTAYSVLA